MKDFFFKNTATKILTVILIVIVFFIFWTSEEFKESEESIKHNLMQYQKGFEASAKFLATVDEMMGTLLTLKR